MVALLASDINPSFRKDPSPQFPSPSSLSPGEREEGKGVIR
jgi:hypothetical protein